MTHGIGHNSGNAPPDLHFIDRRMVLWGAEFLQFAYGDLDNLFISGKAQAAKRRMGFRRTLSFCLDGLVGQEGQAIVMGLCRDTVMDDQHAVKRWCERDDEFAEWVEDARLGIVAYIRCKTNAAPFEERLKHWVAANPRLKRKNEAREVAKRLSREALGALGMLVVYEAKLNPVKGKRLIRSMFLKPDARGATLEGALTECFRLKLAEDAEPHLSRKPDPQRAVKPTELGVRAFREAIVCGLADNPTSDDDDEDPASD